MLNIEKKPVNQRDWLKLMLEGQLTRDSSLKTRTEREEDKRRADSLVSRRHAWLQRAGEQ